MRFPFIFKNRANNSPDHILNQQWQWPSCKKTDITNNYVFFDPSNENLESPETCFSKSTSECTNTCSESEDYYNCGFLKDESLEKIIRGAQSSSSERLFFEPNQSKSISRGEDKFEGKILPFKESVAVVMASKDLYGDFKKSMLEMIQSHGLKDFECVENLLGWYLKMNDQRNHGFILEAFVDMFLEYAASSASSSSHSISSFSSGEPSFSSSSSILSTGGQRGNR